MKEVYKWIYVSTWPPSLTFWNSLCGLHTILLHELIVEFLEIGKSTEGNKSQGRAISDYGYPEIKKL